MKQLAVLSAKISSGKITAVRSLASLAHNQLLTDCDLERAGFSVVLKPKTLEKANFYSGQKPSVDSNRCTECSASIQLCGYGAIQDGRADHVWSVKDAICLPSGVQKRLLV